MNYMQYPMNQQMPYNSPLTRPVYGSQQNWGNRIRPVSSLDEVKASSIDFDGSIFYFPDAANQTIYTKQINLDGLIKYKTTDKIDWVNQILVLVLYMLIVHL